MTDICRKIIDHPSAWTSRSIDTNGLTLTLSADHVAAIDAVLKATRHLAPQAVTRREFDHPALNGMLSDVFDTIKVGRGAVLIKGLDRDRYSDEECERIYWGFGTHWGRAIMQSPQGDRLGHVRHSPDNPNNRSYRANRELNPHTDANEIVGLMCLNQAESGGVSQLVSSIAIHNEILRNRPELLPALYQGYEYAVREAASETAVTDFKMPVFCMVDDSVSCQIVDDLMAMAAERMNTKLPAELAEGISYFCKLATADDMRLSFMLEPGEMMIVNNFTTLHSRTSYQDSATRKRHLLRLWLDVPDLRPVVTAYRTFADAYRFDVDKANTIRTHHPAVTLAQ